MSYCCNSEYSALKKEYVVSVSLTFPEVTFVDQTLICVSTVSIDLCVKLSVNHMDLKLMNLCFLQCTSNLIASVIQLLLPLPVTMISHSITRGHCAPVASAQSVL